MMAAKRETIGFEHKGIGAALAHNRFAVPLNQREYKWEEEHVNELFDDFADAIAKNRGTYFLGSIVLTRGSDDTQEVADGQQRLATTTILLAAIRDYLFENGEKKRARSIEEEYLKTIDFRTEKDVPKLRLNVDDNEFFTNYVVSQPGNAKKTVKPTKDSHKRIACAARLASERVRAIIEHHKESAQLDRLSEWVDFIRDGAQVILLTVPDHLNAFVMFETLNDRGLKASQADLLKNHLLSQISTSRAREGQQKWAQMLGTLESQEKDDITVTFLRHLLISLHGPTKVREVFGKIKKSVNSEPRSIEFLDRLAEGATDYVALFTPDHRKWNDYGDSTREHLKILSLLRVEQIRPLMFSVARHFSVAEAKKAFRLFVCWSVRFLLAGGRGGLWDRAYSLRAQEVGSCAVTTTKALAKKMEELIPNDATFEAAFANASESRAAAARYYLRAIEQCVRGESQPEMVPNEDSSQVNLEHIMPESPGVEWSHIDSEVLAAYHRKLGNMVLLAAKKNTVAGNSSFKKKKMILKDSAFVTTKEVAKYPGWTATEINERQKQLAKIAVKTWPLDVR
jgi:hypothetical protein